MGILIWVVVGIAAGSVADRVMPGPFAGGTRGAIVVGIAGGLFGGCLGTLSDGASWAAIDPQSLLMAICGTLILLFLLRYFAMRAPE